ncbi:hypothetical protein MHYP_G00132180 [Metynnis hypsauchen]
MALSPLCSEQYCRTDGLSVKPTAHNPSPPSRQQQGSPSPLLLSLEGLSEVLDSREGQMSAVELKADLVADRSCTLQDQGFDLL